MILATPLNHHIVTLCTLLAPVAKDPSWKQDNLTWLAVAISFMAGRQGDNAEAAYPVTTRKVIEIIGEETFNEILNNPSHPELAKDRDRRLIAEKVFGALVSEAHEIALSSEAEWHESNVIGMKIRDVMGSMYYAVRNLVLREKPSFEQGMEDAWLYTR